MDVRISCYVMSGGVGSRLWPLSRSDNPKQFHDLIGGGSMMSKTIRRLRSRNGDTPVYLIGSSRHVDRVSSLLDGHELGGGIAIFEPVGRNTAAAVAVATLQTLHDHGDGLVLVVPSDQEVSTDAEFWRTIETGVEDALLGRTVVFGIKPTHPETGYGYIETQVGGDAVKNVSRFVEKPDLETAQAYLASGNFYWNAGMFLFKASAMKAAFQQLQPELWEKSAAAFDGRKIDQNGVHLPHEAYASIPSNSVDYAIMEKLSGIGVVPATFRWSDLGSWQSLLDAGARDESGNVIFGDVVAIDCKNSYLRTDGRLLTAIGLRDMTVVMTDDASFVAPSSQSQKVKDVVETLDRQGRAEVKTTPSGDRGYTNGAWRDRSRSWLLQEAFPLWADAGVDRLGGGFHEALTFDGRPAGKIKRTRTMARQIYSFALAQNMGWTGPGSDLVDHGIEFLVSKARTERGGWVRAVNLDGSVADPAEDAYDLSCVLFALAHAHSSGNGRAKKLADDTLQFIDRHMVDHANKGYLETATGGAERRSNPHMHMLEAFLAWHDVTGDQQYLIRAAAIVDLFENHFFNPDTWTLGEYFDGALRPVAGPRGAIVEPGHQFEWAALLCDYADRSGHERPAAFARKLYASALALGVNRTTGLCYAAISREGGAIDLVSRTWPQTEAVRAAIALNGSGQLDLKPEIEDRVGRLFRRHLNPAPSGMWIDRIDSQGRNIATDVPASILYHLVSALSLYLDA